MAAWPPARVTATRREERLVSMATENLTGHGFRSRPLTVEPPVLLSTLSEAERAAAVEALASLLSDQLARTRARGLRRQLVTAADAAVSAVGSRRCVGRA